jgi:hypothetical protein
VFIHTRVRLPVGAAVDLRFTVLLDDPVVIHGPGRVVHHQDEPRGMGVMFVNLRAEMQLRVIDAINWYRARGLAEAGDRVFRTRELTPDELAQIDEEDGDGADEADEARPGRRVGHQPQQQRHGRRERERLVPQRSASRSSCPRT